MTLIMTLTLIITLIIERVFSCFVASGVMYEVIHKHILFLL